MFLNNKMSILKKYKFIFIGFFLLTFMGILTILLHTTTSGKKWHSCKKAQTLTNCNGKNTCINNCENGLQRCGDICQNKCYNPDKEECIDGKSCKLSNICYKNGKPTDCCTSDNPDCTSEGICTNCTKQGLDSCFIQDSSGSTTVTCCEKGKKCCKGSSDKVGTCCDENDCIVNPSNSKSKICCKWHPADSGECCDPRKQYSDSDGKTKCCPTKICWNGTNKICCPEEEGCQDTGVCLLTKDHKELDKNIDGSCLVNGDKNSVNKKVCQNPSNFPSSTLKKCSDDSDCIKSEKCEKIYYRHLPGSSKCSNDDQCTGLGTQNQQQICYSMDKKGNIDTSKPVECPTDSNDISVVYKGQCSTQCSDSSGGKTIWCPPGDACTTFKQDDGISGSYCTSKSICTPGSITYEPERMKGGDITYGTCKQQYQIKEGNKCVYFDDTSSGKQFTVDPLEDQGKFWCDFSYKGKEGIGNLLPYSGVMTGPLHIAGEYSGYGDSIFNSFKNSDPTSSQSDLMFEGKPVPYFPGGDTHNGGVRSYAEANVNLEGICNSSDCYNKLNEQGIEYINYDDNTKKCTGKFKCDGSSTGLLKPLQGDFYGFDKNLVSKDYNDKSWRGLICPPDHISKYTQFTGKGLPKNAGTYWCESTN